MKTNETNAIKIEYLIPTTCPKNSRGKTTKTQTNEKKTEINTRLNYLRDRQVMTFHLSNHIHLCES